MNTLSTEDIDRIVNAYQQRAEIEKFSHLATIDEIAENGYNCNIPRYVDTFEEEEPIDLAKVKAELSQVVEDKQSALDTVYRTMAELGL
jgi:type I restriction enzyme M protein